MFVHVFVCSFVCVYSFCVSLCQSSVLCVSVYHCKGSPIPFLITESRKIIWPFHSSREIDHCTVSVAILDVGQSRQKLQ